MPKTKRYLMDTMEVCESIVLFEKVHVAIKWSCKSPMISVKTQWPKNFANLWLRVSFSLGV